MDKVNKYTNELLKNKRSIMLANDLKKYIDEKHTQEECKGFIDGYNFAIDNILNRNNKTIGNKRSEQVIKATRKLLIINTKEMDENYWKKENPNQ